MHTLLYDGSFEGFLSSIFEVYEYKYTDASIIKHEDNKGDLFGESHIVITDAEKAERVLRKLRQRLSTNSMSQLYRSFLSEIEGMENILLRFIRYVLASKLSVEHNYAHPDVLMLQQTSRKVHREKHRMEAFVRFQLTKDGLYYSMIQPDFNVLPLIAKHFRDRYADQKWLIYDSRRKYGLYYDLREIAEVSMDFNIDNNNPAEMAAILDEQEELCQQLWKTYFASVNIAARKNMKLHIRHMPKRYWRFLPEKRPVI